MERNSKEVFCQNNFSELLWREAQKRFSIKIPYFCNEKIKIDHLISIKRIFATKYIYRWGQVAHGRDYISILWKETCREKRQKNGRNCDHQWGKIFIWRDFLISYVAVPRTNLSHWQRDGLTHLMFITAPNLFDLKQQRAQLSWSVAFEPETFWSEFEALSHYATLPWH